MHCGVLMYRRRYKAKILIFLLLAGIFAMFMLKLGSDRPHRLSDMEPANPFSENEKAIVELAEIHPERTLRVAVDGSVVEMGLEDYVMGVLAAEMPASFSMEALKAQAVAARTLAVHKIMFGGCSKYRGADICDESGHCQAYITTKEMKDKWMAKFDEYAAKLRQAVSDTAGKIITYHGEPILVLFHSSSSGYTESVENVYSKALPYLRSVPSPGEGTVTELESREEFDRKWFVSTVNKAYPKAKLVAANLEKQVSIASRFPSGRAEKVRLGGVTVTGVEFRRLLELRSTNFSLDFNQYSIVVTAEGYGHGVGMSQYGAEAMAREGNDYADILSYYYTGVKIEDMK